MSEKYIKRAKKGKGHIKKKKNKEILKLVKDISFDSMILTSFLNLDKEKDDKEI